MKALERRVQRLEARSETTVLLSWETVDWERLSGAEKLLEAKRYVTAYPDSALARQFRAMEKLSASERQARIAALEAKERPV